MSRLKKLILMAGMSVMLVVSLCACGAEPMTITEEGMTITLTDEFTESTMENADWYYESDSVLVMGIMETRDELEEAGLEVNSLRDYAEAVIDTNNLPASVSVKDGGDYMYFEYNMIIEDVEFSYLSCVYKDVDRYWMINFACFTDEYDELKDSFFEWADSVEFN